MLPLVSLTGATAPGAGTAKDLEGVLPRHTLHVVETGGQSFSDITVRLEGSHDGTNWIALGSVQITTTTRVATTTVTQHLVRHVRAFLSPDNFSGSPVITATVASGS